jgi:hypothetical protein
MSAVLRAFSPCRRYAADERPKFHFAPPVATLIEEMRMTISMTRRRARLAAIAATLALTVAIFILPAGASDTKMETDFGKNQMLKHKEPLSTALSAI